MVTGPCGAGTDHVLDTIDGALRDYETSPHAMRWKPGPAPDNARAEEAEFPGEPFTELAAPMRRADVAVRLMLMGLGPVARCRMCRPKANTTATRHGEAYRRRQVSRRRRRRR